MVDAEHSFVLSERFNMTAAAQMLRGSALQPEQHKALLKHANIGINRCSTMNGIDVGCISVKYDIKPKRLGRFTVIPQGSTSSLSTMKRAVHNHLASGLYHDIDIANCMPSLTRQLMVEQCVACPELQNYCSNRNTLIQEVMDQCGVSHDTAKELFLRFMHLGSARTWAVDNGTAPAVLPAFIMLLSSEMRSAAMQLLAVHPLGKLAKEQQESRKRETDNPIGTQLSYLVQDAERKCASALMRAIAASGREVGAYIYDGVLVLREGLMSSRPDELPAHLLEDWAAAVKQATGFTILLAEKPLEVSPMLVYQPPPQLAGPSTMDTDGGASSSAIHLAAPSIDMELQLTSDAAEALCSSLPCAVDRWRNKRRLSSGLIKLMPADSSICLFGGPDCGHTCRGHNCCIFVTPGVIMVCGSGSMVAYTDRCLLEAMETALPSDDEDDDRPSAHLRLVRQLEAIAAHFQLRKSPKDSKVFVPVHGAPCA